MARKPEPKPAFFDHYAPFTEALENYASKAGMLLVAAESFLLIAEDMEVQIPESMTNRLKQAISEYKQAAHSHKDIRQ